MPEMNQIEQLTKNCPREDCRITNQGGVSTCMGYIPAYDKKGNSINDDPNTTAWSYHCSVCGMGWSVVTKNGESKIIERAA